MNTQIKKSKIANLGLALSILMALPFIMSASMKFRGGPEMMQGWNHFGWPEASLIKVGFMEALSIITYLIPQTAVLGAILLTGYLGGAIATHMRMQEGVALQALFGVMIWGALYMRDARLRDLIPFRKKLN